MCVHASRFRDRPARARQSPPCARACAVGAPLERRHDAERDVRRLVVRRVGVRHVERQRADRRRARRRDRRPARRERGRVQARPAAPRPPTRRSPRRPTSGPRRTASAGARTCHVSASTVGPLMYVLRCTMPNRTNSACSRPGNQPQHARLLAPFQLRLKADEAVVIAGEVVLPQLHGGVRRAAGARIDEADRLHRPEPQRVLRRGAP